MALQYAFYTGCVAKGAGRELLTSTNLVCKKLGIELFEMEDAACCGAGVGGEDNVMVSDTINARTFALAEERGMDIMNICVTCQGVHKKAQARLAKEPEYMARVNEVLKSETGRVYKGQAKIRHFAKILIEDYGLDKLKAQVVKPLGELKAAAFYGCYSVRPHEYSDFKNPDDPDEMERILEAIGAKTVSYPGRLKCCGFPIIMMNKQNSLTMSGSVIRSAKESGADCLVTQCPLCHLNMDAYQPEIDDTLRMPVVHIQQLIGLALGYTAEQLGMNTHIVSASGALASI
ncbi:MAG: CoB--CoM heterodisulfide reductase iron-sulfur subunit B family protein [Nitrospinota bacterium]|nr:CoB--CoM heterodisulfide reductase iron-sulfur subunit B family protein [Nitrospinota bacterium]MDH5755680.1 CoB--CoM heterodisulfide reductase iron-sulfur subunit B family protein [Nitrospinota bacterium]